MSKAIPPDHRMPIGSWKLPSGNACDVSLSFDPDGIGHLWYEWDRHQLSASERAYYLSVVVPEVAARIVRLRHPRVLLA